MTQSPVWRREEPSILRWIRYNDIPFWYFGTLLYAGNFYKIKWNIFKTKYVIFEVYIAISANYSTLQFTALLQITVLLMLTCWMAYTYQFFRVDLLLSFSWLLFSCETFETIERHTCQIILLCRSLSTLPIGVDVIEYMGA